MPIIVRRGKGVGPVVIGLDLSLTNSGIAVIRVSGRDPKLELIKSVSTERKKFPIVEKRLDYIIGTVMAVYNRFPDAHTALEMLPVGGRMQAGKLYERVELVGALRRGIAKLTGRYVYDVHPLQIKKFVTGSGGKGEKSAVAVGAFKKWRVEFSNNDECDAYCVARFLHALIFLEKTEVAAYQAETIKKSLMMEQNALKFSDPLILKKWK